MKIIENNIIPFKGFAAINLFGVLFTRKGVKINDTLLNHESIHTAQMKELLYVPFYLLYGLEYVYKLFKHKFNTNKAYRNISFEKEAYDNQYNPIYLKIRKHYAQWCKNDINIKK